MTALKDQLLSTYEKLNQGDFNALNELYHHDIEFVDPFHQINGLQQLNHYFKAMYKNVHSCKFDFKQFINDGNTVFVSWKMLLRHKKLKQGQAIQVDGVSELKLKQQKIIYHRDYFDAGALIYENIPLIGKLITWIKKKI